MHTHAMAQDTDSGKIAVSTGQRTTLRQACWPRAADVRPAVPSGMIIARAVSGEYVDSGGRVRG